MHANGTDKTLHATEELEVQEVCQIKHSVPILPETIIAIAILIVTFLENIKTYPQEIPNISMKTVQVVTLTTRTIIHNKLIKRTSKTYRKAVQVITDTTTMTHHNSCSNPHKIPNRRHHHTQNWTSKQKLNDEYNRLYHPYNTTTPHDNYDQ